MTEPLMEHPQGRNAKLVKSHNRSLVLKLILQNEDVSRKDIADITGLTRATITKIAGSLIERELIYEKGTDYECRGSGRKPVALGVNRDKYKIISLYIGRHVIRGAVCDISGAILHRTEEFRTIIHESPEQMNQEVITFIEKVMTGGNVEKTDLLGIAIAAPGPINARKGIMRNSAAQRNLTGLAAPFNWNDLPLKEVIEEHFGINTFADNEANLCALGESWFGSGVEVSNFVLYSIGSGIGSGVIIDGMLYRGEDDVVSEIGHITIDYKGPECFCGNNGCLELYASFNLLVDEYRNLKAVTAGPESSGKADSVDSHLRMVKDISLLFHEAAEGREPAAGLVAKYGKLLGIGAVSLANIFSPEYIIVSGNDLIDTDLSPLCIYLQKAIEQKAFSVIADKVKVIPSKLGNDIHFYGGVALVLQDFFNRIGEED
jgi:predicted NBD/HSP70 family sugar kinase